MRNLLFLVCFAYSFTCLGQHKTVDALGKTILASIVAHDSLQLYSLAMPKEGMKMIFNEVMVDELTVEELKEATDKIDLNYEKNLRRQFELSFYMLTTKVDIHNFNFEDVEFEEMFVPESENLAGLIGVHSHMNHETYKHITFYAYRFKDHWYLFNDMIRISEENAFDTRKSFQAIELSKDEQGDVQVEGSFDIDSVEAAPKDILSCLDKFPVSVGKEDISYGTGEDGTFYMKGNWEMSYFVNRDEDKAGVISYNFEYIVSNETVNFRYSFFVHQQNESEFQSIGLLPLEPNDGVLTTFTEKQYQEILDAILLNARIGTNSRRKLVNRCLKQ